MIRYSPFEKEIFVELIYNLPDEIKLLMLESTNNQISGAV